MSLMIACCTPQLSYAEESLRTVHYACTAGAIRNRPSVKLDPQEQLILYLKKEVRELKQRVQQLTSQLDASHRRLASHGLVSSREGSPSGSGVPSSRDDDSDALTDRPRSRPPSRGLVTVDRPRASMPPSALRSAAAPGTAPPIPTVTISLGDLTGGAPPAPSARKPSVRETLRAAAPAPPELRPVGLTTGDLTEQYPPTSRRRRTSHQRRTMDRTTTTTTSWRRRRRRQRRSPCASFGSRPRSSRKCRRAAVVATPRPQRRRRQCQRRKRRRQRRRQRRRRWRRRRRAYRVRA